jgi:hypothetical protein
MSHQFEATRQGGTEFVGAPGSPFRAGVDEPGGPTQFDECLGVSD